MTTYKEFNVGDAVEVIRPCLLSTGKRGEVVWKRKGLIGVKVPGINGTLSFNPSSLVKRVIVDFFTTIPKLPEKAKVYKIGCKEIGQGINQTFDTKEEALDRLEKWSQQIGGRVCQLYVLDSEYKTEVATKLVKVS